MTAASIHTSSNPDVDAFILESLPATFAQLHTTGGVRLNTASPAHLPSRRGAFPRSSVAPGFLSPPRFHSATPNPACSGLAQLRCARH